MQLGLLNIFVRCSIVWTISLSGFASLSPKELTKVKEYFSDDPYSPLKWLILLNVKNTSHPLDFKRGEHLSSFTLEGTKFYSDKGLRKEVGDVTKDGIFLYGNRICSKFIRYSGEENDEKGEMYHISKADHFNLEYCLPRTLRFGWWDKNATMVLSLDEVYDNDVGMFLYNDKKVYLSLKPFKLKPQRKPSFLQSEKFKKNDKIIDFIKYLTKAREVIASNDIKLIESFFIYKPNEYLSTINSMLKRYESYTSKLSKKQKVVIWNRIGMYLNLYSNYVVEHQEIKNTRGLSNKKHSLKFYYKLNYLGISVYQLDSRYILNLYSVKWDELIHGL